MFVFLEEAGADDDGGIGAVGNEGGELGDAVVFGVKPGDGAVVFDAEVEGAAFGVGETDDGGDDGGIGEAILVAFEFDGEGFLLGDGAHRTRGGRRVILC